MAGYRSTLGSWVGGVSAPAPSAVQAGYRSVYGLWLGGIAAPATPVVTTQAGYRSLLAFWMGGAASSGATTPDLGGSPGRHLIEPRLAYKRRAMRDDQDMLELLLMFTGQQDC